MLQSCWLMSKVDLQVISVSRMGRFCAFHHIVFDIRPSIMFPYQENIHKLLLFGWLSSRQLHVTYMTLPETSLDMFSSVLVVSRPFVSWNLCCVSWTKLLKIQRSEIMLLFIMQEATSIHLIQKNARPAQGQMYRSLSGCWRWTIWCNAWPKRKEPNWERPGGWGSPLVAGLW